MNGLTFGQALEATERREKIARSGWNGRGIYVFLIPGASTSVQLKDGAWKAVSVGSFLAIDTTGLQSDNTDAPRSVVPWLASQTDMRAKDWQVVE